ATVEALRQSHAQLLTAIVWSSDDAIISVDLNGTIATSNGGTERLLGTVRRSLSVNRSRSSYRKTARVRTVKYGDDPAARTDRALQDAASAQGWNSSVMSR